MRIVELDTCVRERLACASATREFGECNGEAGRRTDAVEDGLRREHVVCLARRLDERRANVDGDPCHVLPLRRDGEGADGVRE